MLGMIRRESVLVIDNNGVLLLLLSDSRAGVELSLGSGGSGGGGGGVVGCVASSLNTTHAALSSSTPTLQ